jgi:hypothetical protein
MKIRFEIDTDKINDIQLKHMRETINRSRHAHWTNVELRINGKDERHEADWLKHFVEAE